MILFQIKMWVRLMFSSSFLCLTGAAVCPCQRSHRGHGSSHPEDMPEHQWPQTWGEQQSESGYITVLLLFLPKILTSSCLSLIFSSSSIAPSSPLSVNLLQLHKVAVSRASDLLKVHGEQLPLQALKAAGAEGNLEAVADYSRTLTEQKEQLVEVGRGREAGSGATMWRIK